MTRNPRPTIPQWHSVTSTLATRGFLNTSLVLASYDYHFRNPFNKAPGGQQSMRLLHSTFTQAFFCKIIKPVPSCKKSTSRMYRETHPRTWTVEGVISGSRREGFKYAW